MNLNEIATKADIQEILFAIERLKLSINTKTQEKPFLRSADVRKLLNISDSTLQRLRISSKIRAKKLSGTWFYKLEDIQNSMNQIK